MSSFCVAEYAYSVSTVMSLSCKKTTDPEASSFTVVSSAAAVAVSFSFVEEVVYVALLLPQPASIMHKAREAAETALVVFFIFENLLMVIRIKNKVKKHLKQKKRSGRPGSCGAQRMMISPDVLWAFSERDPPSPVSRE